jgi:hypothetical protein
VELAKEIATVVSSENVSGLVGLLEGVRDQGMKLASFDEDARSEALRRVWG